MVDALSRLHEPHPVAEAFGIISVPQFKFLDGLKTELDATEEFKSLITRVRKSALYHPDFDIRNNLLLHKGRIWLNRGNSFIPFLLEEYHKSPLSSHMGLAKTLSRLQQSFF